ncbi:MAG: hypothetical protein K2O38_03085 [Muribaculaceae bacterium]|nr:hypothetical protein [Muribaculaceae bacterium]
MKLPVATVVKPHGIKGELNILLADMAEPDEDFVAGACLIIEIEGLDVPFFVKSARSRGSDSMLLMLDEVSNEKEAATLAGKTLYVYANPDSPDADDEAEGELTAGALIGFDIVDSETGTTIGRIADLTELTPGCWYFVLEGSEKLIPAVDEMICGVDAASRTVAMDLPEGLAEL